MKTCTSCYIFLVDWLHQHNITKERYEIASRILRILDVPKRKRDVIQAIADEDITEVDLLLTTVDNQEIQLLIAFLEDSIMPTIAEKWLTKTVRDLWKTLVEVHEYHLPASTKVKNFERSD
jgi:hypothetical protein